MATVLQSINRIERELALSVSQTAAGSSNKQTAQLLALYNRIGRKLALAFEWPELQKEYLFQSVSTSATGDTTAGSKVISGLSSTSDIEVGFVVLGSGFSSNTTSVGNNVRVVSVDSATQVTVNLAATTTTNDETYSFCQDKYALPSDLNAQISKTFWDRSNRWQLIGGLTPSEWQYRKSGTIASLPRRRFRIYGSYNNQFYLDPPPNPNEDGLYYVFEYISKNWIRPATWLENTAYSAGDYTWYDGNYYVTSSGGTSGSTAPVHITGSASDGGVTWIYYSGIYEEAIKDTDVPIIETDILEEGIEFLFKKNKSLRYDDIFSMFMEDVKLRLSSKNPAPVLHLQGAPIPQLLGYESIPDTGYGRS